ncbi:hypothetical protein NHX12_023951, partial [Muraenolepis orangiensis]
AKVDFLHQQLLVPVPPHSTHTHLRPKALLLMLHACLILAPPPSHLWIALLVAKLVTKAKASTCSLDPMPTALRIVRITRQDTGIRKRGRDDVK